MSKELQKDPRPLFLFHIYLCRSTKGWQLVGSESAALTSATLRTKRVLRAPSGPSELFLRSETLAQSSQGGLQDSHRGPATPPDPRG